MDRAPTELFPPPFDGAFHKRKAMEGRMGKKKRASEREMERVVCDFDSVDGGRCSTPAGLVYAA